MKFCGNIKCNVVGDSSVGKTSLLQKYIHGHFHANVASICDGNGTKIMFKNRYYHLSIFDNVGKEEYDRLRPLSYPNTVRTCREHKLNINFINIFI